MTFTETTYDALGRRVSEADQAGRTTRFDDDAMGVPTHAILIEGSGCSTERAQNALTGAEGIYHS